MRPRFVVLALLMLAPVGSTGCGSAPTAANVGAEPFEATMAKMVDAMKTGSYDTFVAEGGPKVKSISRPMFATSSGRFGPILKKGYRTRFLAKVRKDDHDLLLWKVEVPAGKEDFEVRMSISNGTIDGFWLL